MATKSQDSGGLSVGGMYCRYLGSRVWDKVAPATLFEFVNGACDVVHQHGGGHVSDACSGEARAVVVGPDVMVSNRRDVGVGGCLRLDEASCGAVTPSCQGAGGFFAGSLGGDRRSGGTTEGRTVESRANPVDGASAKSQEGVAGRGQVSQRGPNFFRNQRARERKKAASMRDLGCERSSSGSSAGASRSFWRGVDNATVDVLKETRAQRLIEENKRAVKRAVLDARRLDHEIENGVMERRVKAEVAVLEGQLSGKYSLVGSSRARGWVETCASTPASSTEQSGAFRSVNSVPSLSTGVSPKSSISVEESNKLLARNKQLEGMLIDVRRKDLVAAENVRLTEENGQLVKEIARLRDGEDEVYDVFDGY